MSAPPLSSKSAARRLMRVLIATSLILLAALLWLAFVHRPQVHHESFDLCWQDFAVLALALLPFTFGLRRLRRGQKQLAQLEASMLDFMDAAADMLLVSALDGRIIAANRRASDLLGHDHDTLLGLHVRDLDPLDYLRQHPELRYYLERGQTVTYETAYRSADGRELQVESRVRKAQWQGQDALIEMVRDISARKRAESALQESKALVEQARNQLETRIHERTAELHRRIVERNLAEQRAQELSQILGDIIDCMPSVIVTVDAQRRVSQWNQQAAALTGISAQQAIGKSLKMLLPQFDAPIDRLTEATRYGRRQHHTRLHARLNDRTYLFDVMVYPLRARGRGVVVRVDDVTERVKLEQALVQSEKMLSLGGLAAGMAHEINNPLGAILQSTQNIERRLSAEWPRNRDIADRHALSLAALDAYLQAQRIPQFIANIREAGERAASIVSDMLAFARPGRSERVAVDLAASLDAAVRLAATDYNQRLKLDFRRIAISRDILPGMPRALAQRNQLEQVLLNLLTNAAQAMGQAATPEPQILLRVYHEDGMAVVEVRDNGPGMTEHVRQRVFEPFFTTKDESSGTGLGLSVSYFIVTDQLKGLMEVESSPGEGSVFRVRLPLAEPVPESTQAAPQIELPFGDRR